MMSKLLFPILLVASSVIHTQEMGLSNQQKAEAVTGFIEASLTYCTDFYQSLSHEAHSKIAAALYELLSKNEQNDLANALYEITFIILQANEYCDTQLKNNDLLARYKKFKNVDSLHFNIVFGFSRLQDEGCTHFSLPLTSDTPNFDYFLAQQDMHDFYATLLIEEQEQLRITVEQMFMFSKNTLQAVVDTMNRYESLKDTLAFFTQRGKHFHIALGFSYPFPSLFVLY